MPGSNTNLETGKRGEGWSAGDDWLMGRYLWNYIVMGIYIYIYFFKKLGITRGYYPNNDSLKIFPVYSH